VTSLQQLKERESVATAAVIQNIGEHMATAELQIRFKPNYRRSSCRSNTHKTKENLLF